MQIDFSTIHNILVIKLRAIGDVVLSTIATKNLRLAFPHARIDFLTEPPSRDVLEGNPFINEVIVFDKKTMSSPKFLFSMRKRKYDLVIDLFCNPRSAFMTRISGARYRLGYGFRGRRYAYNIHVAWRGELHNTEFNLDPLRAIGVEIHDRHLYFPLRADDEDYADTVLSQNNLHSARSASGTGGIVCLNPNGGWETKRWPLSHFAQLADELVGRFGATILLIWGGSRERENVEAVRSLMKQSAVILPHMSLKQLGAILKRCALVVSNDSGPMHIAAAVGTPTLGIYGPTNPRAQGPYGEKTAWVVKEGLSCLGCNLTKNCPIGNVCMTQLEVSDVLNAVERLMNTRYRGLESHLDEISNIKNQNDKSKFKVT
jgi:lipopolysaccharide heptosyltransferase II